MNKHIVFFDRNLDDIDYLLSGCIDDNIYVAGCYNGSGIGVGTLFGEQIALKASEERNKEIEIIEERDCSEDQKKINEIN